MIDTDAAVVSEGVELVNRATRPRSRTTGDMHGGAVGAGLRALRVNTAPPSISADDVSPPDKLSKRLSTRRWSAPTIHSSANDASTAAHPRAPSGSRRRASQIFASLSLPPKANALLSRRRSSATRWGMQKQLHRKLTTLSHPNPTPTANAASITHTHPSTHSRAGIARSDLNAFAHSLRSLAHPSALTSTRRRQAQLV